ncbi:transcriptional regulator [Deefgea piscis]|uniref:transcriptional regulator n=1 Tax=Deefgea piscis TaxID=2739061 RepID=UPI001C82694F|nr:YdaS family helix-turn-helix protein [Deefgea piscis]QZA80202.1 helix-turn-helix domain-containing protein [Deefgea piscis]
MDKITALDKAIELLGGVNELARRIGASPARVSAWRKRGNVPAEFCPEIEKQTDKRVRCEFLRPDANWAYLRGTKISTE